MAGAWCRPSTRRIRSAAGRRSLAPLRGWCPRRRRARRGVRAVAARGHGARSDRGLDAGDRRGPPRGADAGVRSITLGIGGSATSDGAGILTALGALSGAVDATGAIDLEQLDPRLADVDLRIACDVTNPLLGPTGAAATYGPQKGASPAQVAELDAALARYADALEAATGRRERETLVPAPPVAPASGCSARTDRSDRWRSSPGSRSSWRPPTSPASSRPRTSS